MRWSICIISAPERQWDLDRLTGFLRRQIGSLDVELVVHQAEGVLGTLRQACIERATGEYVNFIDDDDLVPHDYVESVYPLLDGVDYIGHRLQLYQNGVKAKPTFHSLRYHNWSEDAEGYYRGVDMKNPIRAAIALEVPFVGTYGEDHLWAETIERYCRPVTEHFIDRPMYFYFHSSTRSYARSGR